MGEDMCERIVTIDRTTYKSRTKSKPVGAKMNVYCGVKDLTCESRTEEYYKQALADLPKDGRPRKLTREGLHCIRDDISENNNRFY